MFVSSLVVAVTWTAGYRIAVAMPEPRTLPGLIGLGVIIFLVTGAMLVPVFFVGRVGAGFVALAANGAWDAWRLRTISTRAS